MTNFFQEMNRPFTQLLKKDRKNILLILWVFFALYFTYSMIRAGVDALFVHQSGASKTPVVWLMSVILLSFSISAYNIFQQKLGLKRFFFWTTLVSTILFMAMLWLNQQGLGWTSYALFVLKEIYIVLLVHLGLAYCNNFLTLEEARAFYGPFGAIGSIGGTLGGQFSTWWVERGGGTFGLLVLAMVWVFITGLIFLMLKDHQIKAVGVQNAEGKYRTPLNELKKVKGYVFFILLIVALSQFCINIANLQFNLKFAEVFTGGLDQKTAFMGKVYAYLGICTLLIQIFIMPVALTYVRQRTLHFLIPLIYLAVAVFGYFLLPPSLWVIGGAFIIFKAMDYSLFSGAKELLYYALSPAQKVGAKYLTDMVIYRFAKGLISLVLIYVQSFFILTLFLLCFLALWIISVFNIFKFQKKLGEKR